MKKILLFICILIFSAGVSPVAKSQCKFDISHSAKTNFDNVIIVFGYTDTTNIKTHIDQLDIYPINSIKTEKYRLKVHFKNNSKILANWSDKPNKYIQWGTSLNIFSDSVAMIQKYQERIPAFLLEKDTVHSRLVKSLPEMQKMEEQMYTEWSDEMMESVEGNIEVYNAENNALINNFIFSKQDIPGAINPEALYISASIKDSNLSMLFIVDKDSMPELLMKVFSN